MGNPFVHIELNTGDVAAAHKFYKKVFDWQFAPMPGMDYLFINVGDGVGGGMMPKPMPDAPTQWLPYVEVASVKRAIAKAQKAGATIIVDYQSIGVMGAIGIFIDPTGAALGVWESAMPPPPKKAAKKPAKKTAKKPAKAAEAVKFAKTAKAEKTAKSGKAAKSAKAGKADKPAKAAKKSVGRAKK